jgi:hypothetical protein
MIQDTIYRMHDTGRMIQVTEITLYRLEVTVLVTGSGYRNTGTHDIGYQIQDTADPTISFLTCASVELVQQLPNSLHGDLRNRIA